MESTTNPHGRRLRHLRHSYRFSEPACPRGLLPPVHHAAPQRPSRLEHHHAARSGPRPDVRERLLATLAAFFVAVALLLAGIGLYAVLNYSILQRRREIGIRMAIGSTRAGIVRIENSRFLPDDRAADMCHSAHWARCNTPCRASRASHRPHRDPTRGLRDRVPLIATLQTAIGFFIHYDHWLQNRQLTFQACAVMETLSPEVVIRESTCLVP